MLVLSRKSKEKIVFKKDGQDDIVISVERLTGNRAVLGIEASNDVRIIREEIIDRPPASDAGLEVA